MKKPLALASFGALFLSVLISFAYAENESIANQFLGSPLLALTVVIIIVAVSFVYRRIRK